MPGAISRPRVRRAVEATAAAALRAVGADLRAYSPPPQPPAPAPPPVLQALVLQGLARDTAPGKLSVERSGVNELLSDRLTPPQVAEIERRIALEPEYQHQYDSAADDSTRRFLLLTYGMWMDVEGVSESTGLSLQQPPEDIHAMARGPLAAAGGLYEADLFTDALGSAGVEVGSLGAALDFGCSSGRVARVLRAAFPAVRWHGCDPNGPAIEWASANLPGIEFFVSGDEPPLQLADASMDAVCAISIWSHFHPDLGLRWFEEMRRLLRPGGHLVCTTHGLTSVAFYAAHSMRTAEDSLETAQALYRQGWWYRAEFGESGDWGVVNPLWGTTFLSPEWLLEKLCPAWEVVEFAAGRNQHNQDVYVLRRT